MAVDYIFVVFFISYFMSSLRCNVSLDVLGMNTANIRRMPTETTMLANIFNAYESSFAFLSWHFNLLLLSLRCKDLSVFLYSDPFVEVLSSSLSSTVPNILQARQTWS